MKTFKHELEITRGETFTIDRVLQNKDGSPYIISNRLSNPHFCLVVSDALFYNKDGYRLFMWLPVDGNESIPRFKYTIPVEIENIKDSPTGTTSKYEGFKSLGIGLPSGYIDGELINFTDDRDALFYSSTDKAYKYLDNGAWKDYECRLIVSFSNKITREWTEKNYWYRIDLISGLASDIGSETPFETIEAVYPILDVTSMNVKSDLKGGFDKWRI